MELRQGRLTAHKQAAPNERTDATQDDAQLVDVAWGSRSSHGLRVAQSIAPLKGVPRYLALSFWLEEFLTTPAAALLRPSPSCPLRTSAASQGR
jgi:hypothetical protein